MAWQRAASPVREGGINALNIKIINEAIMVGWLKDGSTVRTVAGWGLPGGITTGRGVCC